MSTLEERVIKTSAEATNTDAGDINLDTRFIEDLKLDSMDTVELILAMEEEFSTDGNDIEISDEDAQEFKTVRDVVEHLKKLGIG